MEDSAQNTFANILCNTPSTAEKKKKEILDSSKMMERTKKIYDVGERGNTWCGTVDACHTY